ncbi:MAG: DNA-binding protein [Opitutales bacterium]|nr:DNA-binding protein [Opitutales bacterium]
MTAPLSSPPTHSPLTWEDWLPLHAQTPFTLSGIAETLDGGQMFRWNRLDECSWQGVWGRHLARVRLCGDGSLEAAFPKGRDSDSLPALRQLLGLDLPYTDWYARLRESDDSAMLSAMSVAEGLHIVNLPLGEALLSFLCSPMKRIPQIKQVLDNIARSFGEELYEGIHALPSWAALANVDEEALRGCRLGYRAKSIAGTARMLAQRPDFLETVAALPYAEARKPLTELPGVGGKIADCALLYSGTCGLAPFPVDTWISRAMAKLYGLEGMNPEQTASYGRERFGEIAGLAQQFIFVSVRKIG